MTPHQLGKPQFYHCEIRDIHDNAHYESSLHSVAKGVYLKGEHVAAGSPLIEEQALFEFSTAKYLQDEDTEDADNSHYTIRDIKALMKASVSKWNGLPENQRGLFQNCLYGLFHQQKVVTYYEEQLRKIVDERYQVRITSDAKRLAICEANAFEGIKFSRVLCQGYCRLNHSCSPDVHLEHLNGKYLTWFIQQDPEARISHDRQIFTTYLDLEDLLKPASERQNALKKWNFECRCHSCSHPHQSDPKRKILLEWHQHTTKFTENRHIKFIGHEDAHRTLKMVEGAAIAAAEEKLCSLLPVIYWVAAAVSYHLAADARDSFDFLQVAKLLQDAQHYEEEAALSRKNHLGTRETQDTADWQKHASGIKKMYETHPGWTDHVQGKWLKNITLIMQAHSNLNPDLKQRIHDTLEEIDQLLDSLHVINRIDIAYSGAYCCLLLKKLSPAHKENLRYSVKAQEYGNRAIEMESIKQSGQAGYLHHINTGHAFRDLYYNLLKDG